MGRPKFSFSLAGRRSKTDQDDASSKSSVSSVPTWPLPYAEPTNMSKAHRVLGTSEPVYRTTSKQSSMQSLTLQSPGYKTKAASEASFGSAIDARGQPATDHNRYQTRPAMYSHDTGARRGSDNSSAHHRLHPQPSNSTMRSHYDAKTSPLSISQQTSNSAVRDMALRRGQPQVVDRTHDYPAPALDNRPVTRGTSNENKTDRRKSKPARLDISKLFPKPRMGSDGRKHQTALLSPTKMVNSPAAMSMSSGLFPRPMARGPTPQPAKSKKTASQQDAPASQRPTSPVRLFQRDVYDSAKINVRRPPKGIKHWFEGALDEDSDEPLDEVYTHSPAHVPVHTRQKDTSRLTRQTSLDRVPQITTQHTIRPQQSTPVFNTHSFAHEDVVDVHYLTSASEYSVGTLSSMRTKESLLSTRNFQDSSILSSSSSEDEGDNRHREERQSKMRRSWDIGEDAGEIIIGQAQAFEVRPSRRLSRGMSVLSNSTDAATIEVMYTPEPSFSPYQHYPRSSNFSGNRLSSHIRQPSVIPEDEDFRPVTAISTVAHSAHSAYSAPSARTSANEPKSYSHADHKMMAVTEEEKALLELMRKKRAAMNGSSQASNVSTGEHLDQQSYVSEGTQRLHRTSGFLSTETPAASPVRLVETHSKRRSAAPSTPLSLASRGRTAKAMHETNMHDNSGNDAWSERHPPPVRQFTLSHYDQASCDSSRPNSYLRASPTLSPTNTDHFSSLPSPITPGSHTDRADVKIKVASSETSDDDEVAVLESGVIDTTIDGIKFGHGRRRTASSGADMTFPAPPGHNASDLPRVSEAVSRSRNIVEPSPPKLSGQNSKRVSGLMLSPSSYSQTSSRQSSLASNHSHVSGKRNRKSSLASMNGSTKTRNSVSDDVLAAWGSLGGTY
ncbi:hypothetical protein P153DRAFT_430504 [Dothidotthia symphoricarpi CBS 119687]|uniref:Uncharacterized protein n=1 Tax=Dothidotthia symphoricarpi CBS 119687 TaxID=1392245 RepID=A0A6A6AFB4_9PLEO|nr:uncharacterized protein P153DRAFT_430504 [Dothidotthia symphoricarpi CBS 119687]KAF2130246.1 hypothetical protein P153DRAFT_430504 [Dothidotthia symphoricarpi CBS 119687]